MIPAVKHPLITNKDISKLKKKIINSGLTTAELVRTAWAAASSHRVTDMRGGANGARINLAPQNSWQVNNPKELSKVLTKLVSIQTTFNKKSSSSQVSLADLIVLGGAAAIENSASKLELKLPCHLYLVVLMLTKRKRALNHLIT